MLDLRAGDMTAGTLDQNLVTIFFFYGLAFFAMGLALLVESGRSSEFPFAAAMAPLAAFGIIHGTHEWLEMFQLLDAQGVVALPSWLLNDTLRLPLLAVSFSLLTVFGVRLIYANHNPQADGRLQPLLAAVALLLLWTISIVVANQIFDLDRSEFVTVADDLGRYTLAIPGALIAAWAIVLEQRTFKDRGMSKFGRALLGAAVALLLYGTIGQLFVRPSPLFPSNIINSQLFLSLTGMPIQLIRAICAVAMTLFIVAALRAFEHETQQQLAEARQARGEAQKAILEEQHHTEALNQELREALRNLSSLIVFSQSLAKSLDSRELLETALAKFIYSEPHIDASIVFLRDDTLGDPYIASMTQCPADKRVHEIMYERALVIGKTVITTGLPAIWDGIEVQTISDPEHYTFARSSEEASALMANRTMGVPLTSHGQQSGSLVVCTVPGKLPFSAREFSLVSTAADQLSIALQNAALYRAIQERDLRRGELLNQVVTAQEMERQRIARELHDGAGQILTGLGLGLAAVAARLNTDKGQPDKQVEELRQLCGDALVELRDVISDLRPAILDDLGLVPALRGQVQQSAERGKVEAELIVRGTVRRMSPDLETIVFRVVQEALTNVNKHARATAVTVKLRFEDENLHLFIHDNGRGFVLNDVLNTSSGERRAWGLLGMEERAKLAGGTFAITSAPGAGTSIELNFPLHNEKVYEHDKVASG
ncbi:MAG: GAF domain-containing sensor histidine kinase [Candidatus Promineifilaceae bacterium]